MGGENQSNRRITVEQSAAIKKARAEGVMVKDLAKQYGVCLGTIAAHAAGKVLRPPPLEPCGTNAAYQRHVKKKEKPCLLCTDAHSEWHREWRKANREYVAFRKKKARAQALRRARLREVRARV